MNDNTQAPAPATIEELEQLDFSAIEAEATPYFRITDDGCADWAVRKILEERAEYERLRALADEQIAAIETKAEAAKRRYENGTAYLTARLADFFQTVPHKKTKTTEKYRLLNGTLTMKKGGIKAEADDATLVPWLKANGLGDYVKTKETAAWGDLKKMLTFAGGVATIEETGEIVEGVTVTETPDTFKVEV